MGSAPLKWLSVLMLGYLSFGVKVGKTEQDEKCRQEAVLKDLYISVNEAITEHFVANQDRQHVDLLASGIPLDLKDFNPGKKSRFAQPGTLSLAVVENALPLVNKIFPTGATVNPALTNLTQSVKDYHFDSLSSTFDFILTHMMVLPGNFSSTDTLRSKYYLQELVPNPERVVLNETELPRFLLYDYYRSLYLKEKEEKDSQMDSHRQTLTQGDYENWGLKQLPTLESNSNAAFQKWMIFGYKTEVEKELQYFDINTHEDNLMSTRALFKSMAVYSEKEPHTKVYPFSFSPENWYTLFNSKLPESSDELRYKLSLLQAQQALMNATKNDLASKTNEDVNTSIKKIEDIMKQLRERVQNAVDTLLQMEVECFARVNLTVCGDIINTHTAFKHLLDNVAEHFEQALYLESILNGRRESIDILQQKLGEVSANIKLLITKISNAEDKETAETIDLTTNNKRTDSAVSVSCAEAGKIQFVFDSTLVATDGSCSGGGDERQPTGDDEDLMKYCSDVRIPLNATKNPLWHVRSCTVDDDLKAFDNLLENFTTTMNSIPVKVTASLYKVAIKRPWLDEEIFMESKHYTMKRGRGVVSPGAVRPLNYFHQVAESGQYLMPQFTSSLVVAGDISLFFPGLGSWRDEHDKSIDNHTDGLINILMKYTYSPAIEGGYGLFTMAPKGGSRTDAHNFRLEKRNGGVLITVPGAQVIGFISTVISKFPEKQPNAPRPVQCPTHPANERQRRKRSAFLEVAPGHSNKIRELANTLFTESFERYSGIAEVRETSFTPSRAVDKLLKEADATQGRINDFVDNISLRTLHEGPGGEKDPVLPLAAPKLSKDSNINNTQAQ